MKKQLFAAFYVMSVFATTAAYAEEMPSWFYERKIIGNNDLEPIEAVKGTDAYDKANIVARVESVDGSGFCTGSRVAEDLFLTNYHCWEFKPCESIQFHMGYERDLPADQHQMFKCVEVLTKIESLDYALYRVEKVGGPTSSTSKVFKFNALSLEIPDNDTNGVSKDFDIDLEKTISNIKVTLKATHPYVGDLQLKLKSPEGVEVLLHDRSGGGADNLDISVTGGNSLSALLGKQAFGTWTLEARDFARSDVGSVDSLTIEIFYENTESVDEAVVEGEFPIATLWAGDIQVDQLLLVASHPQARLKEIDRSATCKLRTIVPEEVDSRKTITHTCDTEGGSSGSPVLDRATGNIVALHWGGTTGYNLSIPMKLIVEHMKQNVSAEQFNKLNIQR